MKYICPIEYFPNCRTHEDGYYRETKFFESIKDLLDFILKRKDEYAILDIYQENGDRIGHVSYKHKDHIITKITVYFDNGGFQTRDDGHGNLTWIREGASNE